MIIALLLLLYSYCSFSLPEDQVPKVFHSQVLNFWNENFIAKKIPTKKISYYTNSPKKFKKIFVFVPGRTEPVQQYLEYFYDIWRPDIKFVLIDLPGQGASPRPLKDKMKGHLKDTELFSHFIRTVLKKEKLTSEKIILHGNSTGGLAAVIYASQYSSSLKKLVLSAPFIKLKTNRLVDYLLNRFINIAFTSGHSQSYLPFTPGKYRPSLPFKSNQLTYSRNRFHNIRNYLKKHPALLIGGPTIGWLKNMFTLQRSLTETTRSIQAPIQIYLAKQDSVVSNEAAINFCKSIQTCSHQVLSPSKHEIFNETDPIRSQVIADIKNILNN